MKRSQVDPEALELLLARGSAVATHRQLREAGMSNATIMRRISPRGPWQRALPGVVFGHRGTPTLYERRLAALTYAGPSAVLTGLDALAELGVVTAQSLRGDRIHVLIPHHQHRTSHGFATMTRCRELPDPLLRRRLRCAPLARALVDACRRLATLDDVRALVADVVQNHHLSPTDLLAEIHRAARQRTALVRLVVVEIEAGVRSVAEARLREEFARRGVPQPLWNAEIRDLEGLLVASPDALWHDVWVALEMDSMMWHLSPAAYRRTQQRQRRLVVAGVEVIPVSPADVVEDAGNVCRDVVSRLEAAVPRELPWLVVQARSSA